MSQTTAKGAMFNSVFTDLFRYPEYQLRLYKDLHPEDVDVTLDDITDVTLKPVFTNQIFNDLGFRVGDRAIILVEAQSTWSENISLRTMLYLADTFKKYVLKAGQSFYNSKAVNLPKPELYVIYTGPYEHKEEMLTMADTYWSGDDSFIDVKVRVIHKDDPGRILTQYAMFCDIYRRNRAIYGETEEAVKKTIEECIERDILKEYLSENGGDVMDIMTALFDDEAVREMHEKSLEAKRKTEYVNRLVADGKYSVHEACQLLKVDYDAYLARGGRTQ